MPIVFCQQIQLAPYIVRDIEAKLKPIFTDKYSDFLTLLNHTGSVISGSFILSALLNEHWSNADLDLFIPTQYLLMLLVRQQISLRLKSLSFNRPGSCRNSEHFAYRDTITDIEHVRNYGINIHQDGIQTDLF